MEQKQVKMVSMRTFTLATLRGITVHFEARKPRLVPVAAMEEALGAGCGPIDTDDLVLLGDDKAPQAKVDYQGDMRRSMIYLACKSVAEDNNPKEFAGNVPKASVIKDRVGFDASQDEVRKVFQLFESNEAAGNDFQLAPDAVHALRVIEAKGKADLLFIVEEIGDEKFRALCADLSGAEIRKQLLDRYNGTGKV